MTGYSASHLTVITEEKQVPSQPTIASIQYRLEQNIYLNDIAALARIHKIALANYDGEIALLPDWIR